MEGLTGDRGYHATGEVNTAETIRINRNSMTNGNRILAESQVQEAKKITRTLERIPGEVLNKLFEFQKEGVEFGIKRGCRVLIADEMVNSNTKNKKNNLEANILAIFWVLITN